MITFKQFISESYTPEYFLKTKEEIQNWIDEVDSGTAKLTINADLTVDADDVLQLYAYDLMNLDDNPEYKVLPVQFNHCSRDFNIARTRLRSMIGCPTEVEGVFNVSINRALTSLEGCPKRASEFNFFGTGIKNFTGINKRIDYTAKICIPSKYEAGLLSFLLIKGLAVVKASTDHGISNAERETPLKKALEILNTHLAGKRNVIDCQRELIQTGLKEFAKL